jgi:iron complex transport system permease protein
VERVEGRIGHIVKKVSAWLILLVVALISLLIGVQELTFFDLFQLSDIQRTILFSTRIPRTVSLILAGSTLSISGLLMQQLTQNKFVSPTTAGTMASARFGVIMAMIFFNHVTVLQQTIFAFICATVGTLFFTSFLRTIKLKDSVMVPLVGIMFGNIISSVGSYFAIQHEIVQNASSWLQGNFSLISSGNYQLIFLSIPMLVIIYLFAHYFTIMGLGKDVALELGVSYHTIELIGIVLVALATSAIILTVGQIAFVGIIIPNLISLKTGDNFRRILFPTAITGALFLLVMDIFARWIIFPYEVPVSVVVGVIGSALFLYLLLKGEKA